MILLFPYRKAPIRSGPLSRISEAPDALEGVAIQVFESPPSVCLATPVSMQI